MTIGIIGQGYVGTAIKLGFQEHYKIERMKTLLLRNGTNSVEGEPVTDSFSDVSNYGVMAQVVARGKWAK